jgi:hypothetical protein
MSRTNMIATILIIAIAILGFYLLDPTFAGLLKRSEGFDDSVPVTVPVGGAAGTTATGEKKGSMNVTGATQEAAAKENPHVAEGFADIGGYEGPAEFGAAQEAAGCYPRDQLTPSELLPKDTDSTWSQMNPMGSGSLKGKNFLSAGALIGVDTVGQSLRNANYQLRSEPPNPQVAVSVFANSTISPDMNRRTLEIA